MWMDNGAGWWFGMWISMLVFWALAAFAVWAVIGLARRDEGGGRETPEQIVKRRLASGEIGPDEYGRLMTELRGGTAAPRGGASPPGPGATAPQ